MFKNRLHEIETQTEKKGPERSRKAAHSEEGKAPIRNLGFSAR